jgi:hypothetical protein
LEKFSDGVFDVHVRRLEITDRIHSADIQRNLRYIDEIRKIHAIVDPGYVLPDLLAPIVPLKSCVLSTEGHIIAADAVRLVGEGFLFVNPEFHLSSAEETRDARMQAITMLNDSTPREARKLGLEQITSWIPPSLQSKTITLLDAFGWKKSPWPSYTLNL